MLLISLALAAQAEDLPAYSDLLPDTPSFATAKKRMYEKVYFDHPHTLYCMCSYEDKVPDLGSCAMAGVDLGARGNRTEVEHIVPAAVYGRTRPCWADGGRANCEKVDPVFQAFHADLHNLAPTVGAINGFRSDLALGLIEGEERAYGECDFEIDPENGIAEPAPAVRGDVARVYFYVEYMYGLPLTEGERRLLLHWHQTDPVDAWERTRDQRIEELQGNGNPFVR